MAEPVDELHVELVPVHGQLGTTVTIDHRRRSIVRHLIEGAQSRLGAGQRLLGVELLARRMLEDAVRREDRQARIVEADEHGEDVDVRPIGERGLVAVVAVGDQQLPVGERLGDPVGRETPQPRALDLEVRLAVGPPRDRLALVEEEERLQLRAGLTEQAQTAFLRDAVCALVGQDDPRLVRLGPQRGHKPLARTGDLVRADVVLRQPPDALGLVLEHSVGAPLAPEPARFGLVVGQRQMDDVVRARGAEALALLGRDHVVRRGDEALERPGRLDVANGAKRLDLGHRGRA